MTLHICIHNVGHGQAVHAATPNNQIIVIDLGCSGDFSPLKHLKTVTDTIDYLIITHPHGDHIEEMLELETLGFKGRQFWRPGWLLEEEVRAANQSNYSDRLDAYFANSQGMFTEPLQDHERVGNPIVNGGVTITEFASATCGTSNINNHSGVIIFEYLGVKIVIPGDNEPASWNALLQIPAFVDAISGTDIFMASHHGRESGYCSALFNAMSPKLCIVSDGRVQDTDATTRYSSHASSWNVQSRSGAAPEKRKCLTTRTDGSIEIIVGQNNNGRYMEVRKD